MSETLSQQSPSSGLSPPDVMAGARAPLTGPVMEVSERAVAKANQPRSRCAEQAIALIILLITIGVTAWIITAIVTPLVFHSKIAHWYNILLGVLAGFAMCVSCYIFQIGWGAFRWTRKYRTVKDVDWYKKYAETKAHCDNDSEILVWKDVQHFVIVPNYKEPLEMLQLLAYTLMSQRAPQMCRRQITFVLAMEEREGLDAEIKAQTLKTELSPYFKNVLVTFHPPDLPGDLKGKASNYKFAVKEVEQHIRDMQARKGRQLEHMCLIHVADADSLYDPNYFPNVTHDFCVDANRYFYVWQACMLPTCNFWELAAPCRQVNTMIAAQEMMAAYDPLEFQIPFSTYGYALSTLQLIGGTGDAADAQDGDVIAEDHHLFIKGFFALEGRLRVRPIFLPCLNFSVGGEPVSFCKNLCDRFVQAKRHMFGVSELVYLLSLIFRADWKFCCRRRGRCCGCTHILNLLYKLLKIHGIPYLGLWVLLGVILTGLLTLDQAFCNWELPSLRHNFTKPTNSYCIEEITGATKTVGAFVFSIATAATLVGTLFLLVAFVRMLHATHHTLQNIADPNGSFMGSGIWDVNMHSSNTGGQEGSPSGSPRDPRWRPHRQTTPTRRRPYTVGGGFPWVGSVLQLFVEFLLLGFISSMLFGTIPAWMAMFLLVCKGHRFDYVTAPKGPGGGAAPAAEVESMDTLTPPPRSA